MKLSDIIKDDTTLTVEDISKKLTLVDFFKKILNEVYDDYYGNLSYFILTFNNIIKEIREQGGDLTENSKLELFYSMSNRIEQVEFQMFYFNSNKNKTTQLLRINNTDMGNLKQVIDDYVSSMCEKYTSLDEEIEKEINHLYLLKCELIDTFDSIS